MTEREKIVKIMQSVDLYDSLLYRYCIDMATANKLADALITAGIGDVTAWKERAEKAEKECDEYRKSTRIALRGIEILKRNIIGYFATEFPSILQQAEREIEEEKGE